MQQESASCVTRDDLIKAIVTEASERKATDIVLLDVSHISSITDVLVIASCSNSRQIKAIAEAVEEILKKRYGLRLFHVDGLSGCNWVVLDYGDVILHLFLEAFRELYDLEGLWSQASRTEIDS